MKSYFSFSAYQLRCPRIESYTVNTDYEGNKAVRYGYCNQHSGLEEKPGDVSCVEYDSHRRAAETLAIA